MLRRWFNYLVEKGFFSLFTANILAQMLGFGTSLIVAKFTQPQTLGDIRLIQSYAAVFAILAGLGLNTAVLRFCADEAFSASRAGILRYSFKSTLFSAFAVALVLAVVSATGCLSDSPRVSFWLVIYGLSIPATALTMLLMTYLQAVKRITEMARSQVWIKLQSFVLIAFSTWCFELPGFVISTVIAFALGLVPLVRQVDLKAVRAENASCPPTYWSTAIFSVLANGVGLIGQYGDLFVLDHLSKDRVAIGYYSFAAMLCLGVAQVTNTAQSIATPHLGARNRDKAWFIPKVLRVQARLTGCAALVAVSVFFFCKYALPVCYGEKYSQTTEFLAILLVRYVVWSAYAIASVAVFAMGYVWLTFIIVAIATPIAFVLMYYGMRLFGLRGVAWAQVTSALLILVLVYISLFLSSRHHFAKGAIVQADRDARKVENEPVHVAES